MQQRSIDTMRDRWGVMQRTWRLREQIMTQNAMHSRQPVTDMLTAYRGYRAQEGKCFSCSPVMGDCRHSPVATLVNLQPKTQSQNP